MGYFTGKTVFITGGSRGIGEAIALRLAREGANIAIAAKTTEPNPKLPGTIYTAAGAIEAAGGKALPLMCDIRFEDQVQAAVQATVAQFGGLDILVNNASAISLTGTLETEMKRFDLMHSINLRGTFLVSKTCLPHLLKAPNPHVLNLSPPLSLAPHWFGNTLAYTMAKYGMSMCVLGMSEEFRGKVAVNALWPRTSIATAAVKNLLGGDDMMNMSRWPSIVADSVYWMLQQPAATYTGNFAIDEEVLTQFAGITDFADYAVVQGAQLMPDFFLEH
jgi:citronellol/citronellal dehydrogenase